jgi:N-acetylglucosaminyl-diphospho-decaprenol L-rhamnosyltransferase
VNVSAVVVTHGPQPELAECVAALATQVDDVLVIANDQRQLPALPGATVVRNKRPQGYAANANLGIAATTADFIVLANPDAIASPGAIRALHEIALARPRAGILGPRMHYPDGTWQPSRRRFPTVAGTLVRRTPVRRLFPPQKWQRSHYQLDERPDEPVQSEWLLGAFLFLRRTMLDELNGFDAGYRLYGEDIDLCYRAARADWERWYVPSAVVEHTYDAAIDQRFFTIRTVWHLQSMLRFVRKHPERLLALR